MDTLYNNTNSHIPSSYRPISLVLYFSKICVKACLKKDAKLYFGQKIILERQFGFRERHTLH